ncbi:SCAN domain-containing protein 3 [Trichonephila clavipes]|nr:SCAN domain-containing protein 3 [Trichonephila clavipes]
MNKFLSRKRTFDDNIASTSTQTSKVPKPDVKKPHKIAEELVLPAAIEIVEIMFGDNFAKELLSMSLSNDTVSRRIDDTDEDVDQQFFGKLRDKLFSIQLDEATDSNKDAHFIAYVRFWDAFYGLINTVIGLLITGETLSVLTSPVSNSIGGMAMCMCGETPLDPSCFQEIVQVGEGSVMVWRVCS